MNIGVLDIQGSVIEHVAVLKSLGGCKNCGCGCNKSRVTFDIVRVKTPADLKGLSGLIIPGGESTTIGMLLRRFVLRDAVVASVNAGMALWGTCAGAILMAKEIVGEQKADTLKLMDAVVERNGYGRQLDSFEAEVEFDFGAESNIKKVPAVFIRAPKIVSVGEGITVLARFEGDIVAAKQGNLLVTNFHPELTDGMEIHKYFIGMCGLAI